MPPQRVTAKPRIGPDGEVGVQDRQEGTVVAGCDGGLDGLTEAELFTHTLEDQHVGVHGHADGEHEARDAGEREDGELIDAAGALGAAGIDGVKDAGGDDHARGPEDDVEGQGNVGDDAAEEVVEEHEEEDRGHADDGGEGALLDGFLAEGRGDGASLHDLDGDVEGARVEDAREAGGLGPREVAGDLAVAAGDGLTQDGRGQSGRCHRGRWPSSRRYAEWRAGRACRSLRR